MTIHLTQKQLEWLAGVFQAADIETKIRIDGECHLEQQLVELGLIQDEEAV
jgi:hypothetical protein